MPRDLFGQLIREPRPRYEAALERHDRATRPARAERVRWLAKSIPRNIMMVMPLETMVVFQEAKSAFIDGQHVATVVLAASFLEHWFASKLTARGFGKEADKGLAASISCARSNRPVPEALLRSADRLRQIRNPFVHLKSFDHPHNVSQRSFALGKHPREVIERDARESLLLMYSVALHAFSEA
jgi:hypothetical protein